MLEELHPTLGWRGIWLRKIIIGNNILCYFMMIYIFMGVLMRLLWSTWSLHVFFAHYLVQNLVEVLHSLLGWRSCGWLYWCALYILEQHNGTWDPHLCHWSRFDWSLEACIYLANGSLLTGRYKYFHDLLVRHLLDVHYYYVVIYFDDIYYALIMFGIMHTRKWDPWILFPNGMGWRALLIVGVQCKKWDPRIVFSLIDFKFFGKQAVWEMDSPFNKVMLIRVVQ